MLGLESQFEMQSLGPRSSIKDSFLVGKYYLTLLSSTAVFGCVNLICDLFLRHICFPRCYCLRNV